MENTTKERILDAALVGFAENGYKGTNLRDLAAGMLIGFLIGSCIEKKKEN